MHPDSTAVCRREPCKPAYHAGGCSDAQLPGCYTAYASATSLPQDWNGAHTLIGHNTGQAASVLKEHDNVVSDKKFSSWFVSCL